MLRQNTGINLTTTNEVCKHKQRKNANFANIFLVYVCSFNELKMLCDQISQKLPRTRLRFGKGNESRMCPTTIEFAKNTYILLAFSGVSNSKYKLSTWFNFFSSNNYEQTKYK